MNFGGRPRGIPSFWGARSGGDLPRTATKANFTLSPQLVLLLGWSEPGLQAVMGRAALQELRWEDLL